MKKIFSLTIAALAFSFNLFSQSILTQVDSIKINGASIWGGISYDGHRINVTTMSNNHINLVKFDTALNQIGSMIPITTTADIPSGTSITDHKHVFINDHIYVTFSNTGDEDLLLFEIDTNGNRIGNLDSVAFGFTGAPTNDMVLTTDSSNLSILHFKPGTQSWVYQYDFNLNKLSGPVATSSTLPHNNIGNAIINNGKFLLFTGDIFGFNASVVLTKWNTDWTPAASSAQTIIPTSGGDGKWFSSGVAYDAQNERLYLGYQHIYSTETMGQEHVDIAVVDKNFNVEETQHVTASGYYRPHFLLLNGYLYMTYDLVGGVYIKKYKVAENTTVGLSEISLERNASIQLYPNPSQDEVNIIAKGKTITGFELYNHCGSLVKVNSSNGETVSFTLKDIKSGAYFVKIKTSTGDTYRKLIVL